MEEREIRLVKGESYVCSTFKMVKGQTRFVSKEDALRLVSSGRFVYTANERGESKIKCPYCKKEFELTDSVKIKQNQQEEAVSESSDAEETKKDEENGKTLVCQFCLKDDFKTKSGLKSHIRSCEFNPANSKEPKDGTITTDGIERPSEKGKGK